MPAVGERPAWSEPLCSLSGLTSWQNPAKTAAAHSCRCSNSKHSAEAHSLRSSLAAQAHSLDTKFETVLEAFPYQWFPARMKRRLCRFFPAALRRSRSAFGAHTHHFHDPLAGAEHRERLAATQETSTLSVFLISYSLVAVRQLLRSSVRRARVQAE